MARHIGAKDYLECSAKTKDGLKNIFHQAARLVMDKQARRKSTLQTVMQETSCTCILL